jgi:predicted nucleic acid-binding protein
VGAPFVLDTGGLIDYEAVDLAGWAAGTVLVSAVTVGELAHGVDTGDAEQRARRRERLPFGVEEAKLHGALATVVRASGRDPRPRRLDLQIAATAAAARLPLLTTNPDDFVGTEALVEVVGLRRA